MRFSGARMSPSEDMRYLDETLQNIGRSTEKSEASVFLKLGFGYQSST